jgi:hypothetical protein
MQGCIPAEDRCHAEWSRLVADYVFRASGTPAGFIARNFIFDIYTGEAVGQLKGTHAFSLEGRYVGELRDQMIARSPASQGSVAPAWIRPVAARPLMPSQRIARLGAFDAWDDLAPRIAAEEESGPGDLDEEATDLELEISNLEPEEPTSA